MADEVYYSKEALVALINLAEELVLRLTVRQIVLEMYGEDGWREEIEKCERRYAPKTRELFDGYRAAILANHAETPQPTDWQEIVRKLIQSVDEDDLPK